jgi:hypothetical protein
VSPPVVKLRLTRDVTPDECDWLDRTWSEGDIVLQFFGATYGCVTGSGIACSYGDGPFFELPADALKEAGS